MGNRSRTWREERPKADEIWPRRSPPDEPEKPLVLTTGSVSFGVIDASNLGSFLGRGHREVTPFLEDAF